VRVPLAITARTWFKISVIAACTLAGGVASGADRVNWAVGAELQQQLAETGDVLWAGNPLRQAFESLSRARRVAILIDRRVDPGQKLDVSLKGVSLETALQTIALRRGLGVARLGSVVYLGPPAATERLAGIAAALEKDVRRLPPAVRRKYHETKAFVWEDLATPRKLLAELAENAGLEIAGLELVPHDLWTAADLPPLPLVERLTLIAVQFDLGLKVADRGQTVELVPLSAHVSRQVAGQHRTTSRTAPKATTADAGEELKHIDHLVVQEKPLGPVLKQLAERLGLQLKIDQQAIAAAGISMDQRVSVRIENATVDDVFRQLLKPTGLDFHRRGRVVEIAPAE
jgi:hypothetical protein